MGGISSVLGSVAKSYAESTLEQGFKLIRSGESEGVKSAAGKWIVDTASEMMTAVKKDAQTFVQGRLQQIPVNASNAIKKQIAEHNINELNSAHEMAKFQNVPAFFGNNREYLSHALKLAEIQRGPIHRDNLADMISVLLRESDTQPFKNAAGEMSNWRKEGGTISRSPFVGQGKDSYEQKIKDFLGLTYLGRVVIPHTMQHMNALLTDGVSAYAKAWKNVAFDYKSSVDWTQKSGALFEEQYRNYKQIMEGKDTVWHSVIHMPLFSKVRQFEIVHAAVAGKYAAMNAVEHAAKGDRSAELQLKFLGLDPAHLKQAGWKLSEDDLLTAGYKSADENLFIDRGLKTPWAWEENSTSRLLSLYKGFQFREGKLIKDTIKRGLKGGPVSALKTLTILGTAFPIAGELVSTMENLVTGHSPTERKGQMHYFAQNKDLNDLIEDPSLPKWTDEYIDAMGHLATFGISYSMMRAAGRNAVTSYMIGPLGSLMNDFIMGGYYAGKGNQKPLIKAITRRFPVVGPAIAAHYDNIAQGVSDALDKLGITE